LNPLLIFFLSIFKAGIMELWNVGIMGQKHFP